MNGVSRLFDRLDAYALCMLVQQSAGLAIASSCIPSPRALCNDAGNVLVQSLCGVRPEWTMRGWMQNAGRPAYSSPRMARSYSLGVSS